MQTLEHSGIVPTAGGTTYRAAIDRVINTLPAGSEPALRYNWLVDRELSLDDAQAGFYRQDTQAGEAVTDAASYLAVLESRSMEPNQLLHPEDGEISAARDALARARRRRAEADTAFLPARNERTVLQDLIKAARTEFGRFYNPDGFGPPEGLLAKVAGAFADPDRDQRYREIPLAKLPKIGRDPLAVVDEQRAVRAELLARRADIKAAPPPAAEVKAALAKKIATLAEAGRPTTTGGLAGRIQLPMRALNARPTGPAGTRVQVVDTEALAARYWGKEILADLEAEIDESYLGVDLILDAKGAREALQKVAKDLAAAELIEITAAWAAIRAGHNFVFRADTTPATLLGIA